MPEASTSHLTSSLVLLGALLLLALGAYALLLWRRVWARQQARGVASRQQRQRLGEDLRLLTGSLLDEQIPLIEGAIRIKVLLDHFSLELSQHPRCAVFHRLFDATAQIPTHQAWQALDKLERRRHEVYFHELELQHKADARAAARWLLEEGLAPA